MSDWHADLNSRWFAVSESRLLRDKPLGIRVLDKPVALARLHCGKVLALEDRCPHRMYPLSKGLVTDKGLQCGYHGWTFGANGRCAHLPGLVSQSDMPNSGVASFQTIEHDGLIWLRLTRAADDQETDPKMLPPFIANMPRGSLRFLWSTHWAGNAFDALENFLDPLHTHMTHPGLVRRDASRRKSEVHFRRTGEDFTVEYTGQADQGGLLFRLFESPRVLEKSHYAASTAGSARIEYRYHNASALHFTLHFTPETKWMTRVHATLHVENRFAPAWLVRTVAWPFLRRVASQDQRAVELQAINRQKFERGSSDTTFATSPGAKGASTHLDLVRASLDEVWAPSPNQSARPADWRESAESKIIQMML